MSSPSPEASFLLRCSSPDEAVGWAANGALGTLDQTRLLEAADYHGVVLLVRRALNRAAPGEVSDEIEQRLREASRLSAQRSFFLAAKLIEILDALQSEGVAALPLKGPVLAEALYPDPALRPSSDLDILVRRPDVSAALRVLGVLGYELGAHLSRLPVQVLVAAGVEVTLRHPRGAQVDLHWALAPADYPFRFDPEVLWQSARPARLCGREVPALGPSALLLFLCMHGTKHLWSRLMWLGDVARLMPRIPDWGEALALAAEARCTRPVLLGLLLAHELLGAAVPRATIDQARADRVVETLARQALSRLCRIPPSEPGSLELTVFNARLAERAWDKARHCLAMLAPTEAEWQLLYLPVGLRWALYPLRVGRLAVKYAAKVLPGR